MDRYRSIEPENNDEENEQLKSRDLEFKSSEDEFFNGKYEDIVEISTPSGRPKKLEHWMFKITPKGKEEISECYGRGLGGMSIVDDFDYNDERGKALTTVAFSNLGSWYDEDFSIDILKKLEDEGLIVFVGKDPKEVVKKSIEEIREAYEKVVDYLAKESIRYNKRFSSPTIWNGTDPRLFVDVLSAYEGDDVDEETLDKAIESAKFIVRNEIHHPRWARKAMRLLEAGEDKKVVLNKLLYAIYDWTPACAYPFGEFETEIWTPMYSAVYSLFDEGNLELDEETEKNIDYVLNGLRRRTTGGTGTLREQEPGGGHNAPYIEHFILDDEKTRYGLVRMRFNWNDERGREWSLKDNSSRLLASAVQDFIDMNIGDAEIVKVDKYKITLRYYTQNFLDKLLEYLESNGMYVTLFHDAEFG